MLRVYPSTIIKTGTVVTSIPLSQKPSMAVFRMLRAGMMSDMKENRPHGAELSAILNSFIKAIGAHFAAPGNAIKSKMIDLSYNLNDRDFIITCKVANPTVLSGFIKAILKLLTVIPRLKSSCKEDLASLGLKLSDEEFDAAAGILLHSAKKIKFAIVGAKISDEKIAAFNAKAAEMLKSIPDGSDKKLAAGVPEQAQGIFLKGSKLGQLILSRWLDELKITNHVFDNGVFVPKDPKGLPKLQQKILENVDDFITKKYTKYVPKLEDYTVIMAAQSGYFAADDIPSLKGVTLASYISAVKAMVK